MNAHHNTYYVIRVRHLRMIGLLLLLIIGLVTTLSGVLAAPGYATDGRINVVHHFGGDNLYCVTASGAVTNAFYSGQTGFQLLNINGQPIWAVSAAAAQAAVDAAEPGGSPVLVEAGTGSYGPAAIYVYKMTDGTIRFIFTGVDEHSKANQLDFEGCQPVNPSDSADSGSGSGSGSGPRLCTPEEVNIALDSGDLVTFFACFEAACPGLDFISPEAGGCFCSQYPTALICWT